MSVAVVACPTPILAFFNNLGQPNAGGTVLTQVGGVNAPTYQDSAGNTALPNPIPLNSRGEISNASGLSCQLFLPTNVVYTLTVYDASGNQLNQASYVNGASLTQENISAIFYPILQSETNAGATVAQQQYPYGDLRRYGGDPTGTNDSSVALQDAVNVSAQTNGQVAAFIPAGCIFKIVTGATVTGQITVQGDGKSSVLLCDAALLTVHAGTDSVLDNFNMKNITAPWVVVRNPANIREVIPYTSLVQSSTAGGYQPSGNDAEYSTWVAAIPALATQNIGPLIYFDQAASGIRVTRIFGRFARIEIRDAVNSLIADCEILGGKGQWGTLYFNNGDNGIQRGLGNRILRNRVNYGTFSGCVVSANDDFQIMDNECSLVGESGTKTLQAPGVAFTGNVAGATGGTLQSANLANGSWQIQFSDGSVRTCTVAGTAVTWTGALASGYIATGGAFDGPGTGFDAVSYGAWNTRGIISGNKVHYAYFDGLDCLSTYGGTFDGIATWHLITGNHCYGCGGDGANADGRYNLWVGNYFSGCQSYGIWNEASRSVFKGNYFYQNNQAQDAEDLPCSAGNLIEGNYIFPYSNAEYGLYATGNHPDGTPTVLRGNVVLGGPAFYGNAGAVTVTADGNLDNANPNRTRQSFTLIIRNSGGVLQHVFYNDVSESTLGLSARINNASSGGYTNTPTGTDATTAMAAGVKVSTTQTNALVLDTANQNPAWADMVASVCAGTLAGTVFAAPSFRSFNVDGVTQYRLCLELNGAGGAIAINTTNIPSGGWLQIQFNGYLS